MAKNSSHPLCGWSLSPYRSLSPFPNLLFLIKSFRLKKLPDRFDLLGFPNRVVVCIKPGCCAPAYNAMIANRRSLVFLSQGRNSKPSAVRVGFDSAGRLDEPGNIRLATDCCLTRDWISAVTDLSSKIGACHFIFTLPAFVNYANWVF